MKLQEFLKDKFKYDNYGQYIWLVQPNGNHQKIADLRGWGAIQNLFKDKSGKIDMKEAEKFQDELGEWVATALNEKLGVFIPPSEEKKEASDDALKLLERASGLVGNPACGVSSSCDIACDNWQKEYELFIGKIKPTIEGETEEIEPTGSICCGKPMPLAPSGTVYECLECGNWEYSSS